MLGTIFAGFVTALTGGVVAAFVTYRLNANKEQIFFMHRKAEELFMVNKSFSSNLKSRYSMYADFLEEKQSKEQAASHFNEDIKSAEERKKDWINLLMIVNIYFSSLEKNLLRSLNNLALVENSDFDVKPVQDRASKAKRLRERLEEFNAAVGEFEAAIVAEARKLAAPERVLPSADYGAALARASAAAWPWLKARLAGSRQVPPPGHPR